MYVYKFESGAPSAKEIKRIFKRWTDENPEDFFPVRALRRIGFERKKCIKCGRYFWQHPERKKDYCGDPICEGGYSFIGKTREKKLGFTDIWTRFKTFFEQRGYKPIKRYPVIARWNPTVEFTIASITDFQPYVVSGEMPPPAELLTVPQICLRFSDIDNVGFTGRHYTGFTMIGQHAFLPKERFDQEKYFLDLFEWFVEGMGLDKKEIVIHEDSWGGGGNFGACLEFFSGGLELGNQVYPSHEVTKDGLKEMKLRVLDMGMGQERCVWFLRGSNTSYEAVMPQAIEYIYEKSKFKPSEKEKEIIKRFLPYSGLLARDELGNVEGVWEQIANKLYVSQDKLRDVIEKWGAVNAIAEHSRTLLYALSDGGLPSNVGGGYNLRTIFRRAMDFIERFGWSDVDLTELAEIHADSLKGEYPELKENLKTVKKIMRVEKEKYYQFIKKRKAILRKLVEEHNRGKTLSKENLAKYYDSFGLSPYLIRSELKKKGIEVEIPENFYAIVSELHKSEKKEKTATKKELELDIPPLPETKKLYLDNYLTTEFKAEVIWRKDNYIVLNQTAFYPTSGGQLHDVGKLFDEEKRGYEVEEVIKYKRVIIHKIKGNGEGIKKGEKVIGKIDRERRIQLTQHHTAAHIINGAARRVLGEHVWQAGAAKTEKKGRLDITHYEALSEEEIKRIEELANKIVKEDRKVKKYILERGEAEARFGFRIYQGGAVPGVKLRIVEIENFDVEACGGTHLNSTREAEIIRIIKSTKIQDGVIRIEFAAGKAAKEISEKENELIRELERLLQCKRKEIIGRVKELFEKWKKVRKAVRKKREIEEEWFSLKSHEQTNKSNGEIIKESAQILSTQAEHLSNTLLRFLKDLNMWKEKLKEQRKDE